MSETPVHFLPRFQEDAPVPAVEHSAKNHAAASPDHQPVPEDASPLPQSDAASAITIAAEDISDLAPPPELVALTASHALLPEEAAELAWLAETRRFIILRLQEWVIPVSALMCFLLAVLFEAGLVATVWWLVIWHPPAGGGSRGQQAGTGTAIGGIIQSSSLGSRLSDPTAHWHSSPMPAPPELPDKPIFTPHTPALALLDNTNPLHEALPIIGINSDHHAWAAPAHQLAPKAMRIKITPRHTQRTRSRGPQVASRGAQPDAAGGGGGNGLIQLFKPGSRTALGSATGSGPGRGRGPGVGGGGSIVKPPPNPVLPLKYQFALPADLINPKFQLTIRRNGTVAAVKVLTSSGHPGIDQAIINALMQARFLPNILAGKPVQSKFVISYKLTS